MSRSVKDDVDRLFECFKCGFSPPQSAIRERKGSRSRLKAKSPRKEACTSSGLQSPLSARQSVDGLSNIRPSSKKLSTVTDEANVNSAGRQISPVLFYGSPHGVPPKKPSSLLRLLREIRIDLAEKHKSNLRKEVWATFPRQEEAIKFAEQHTNVRIFSYQDHFNGMRRFLVSTYEEFWRRYKHMDPKFRHHYEVIQETQRATCWEHLGKVYNMLSNPIVGEAIAMRDGLEIALFEGLQRVMLETDCQHIAEMIKRRNPDLSVAGGVASNCLQLADYFLVFHCSWVPREGLPCHIYFDLEFNKRENADKNGDQMVDLLLEVTFEVLLDKYSLEGNHDWVIELDSSTQEKFSRHLVIRIPRAAFKDNSHVGAFVAEVCSRLHSSCEEDSRFRQLFISKDSTEPTLQLFVDNAVYSRNRCFRLALSSKAGKTSMLLPTGRSKCKDMNEEEMFMASLICNMDDDCEKLLICKMEVDCMKTLHFDTEVNYNYRKISNTSHEHPNFCTPEVSGTYFMGQSPFPALDAFIESVGSIGSVSGKIRCWYFFSQYDLMVYSMSRNRYCERIGREHKSNHVMYIVDLRWALYYQKCYDPDCQGYRSPSRPVPLDLIPEGVSSEHTGHNSDLTGNEVKFTEADEGEMMVGECSNEKWWHEAIRVAEAVESMGNPLDFGIMEEDVSNEDIEWLMAVEGTSIGS